ncbi:MAG: chemoreceptor glutamine deamidase CheD [Halieaceae bacterium]|jgi:chemotaxis protein CheD|nr:chemoreceptor glutamine deamidase CheD [Halieaceae bacterium]
MTHAPSHKSNWPKVLPGFENIQRMWDVSQKLCSARISPGEFYVSRHNELITTVLGSCVSACVRDTRTGVGGMNHFMLPGGGAEQQVPMGGAEILTTRYGLAAMESLINEILKAGGSRDRMELKLFGGGKVLAMEVNNVGERNIIFAKNFALAEGFKIMSEDLGGEYPRKVNYFPRTGKVMVRRLRSLQCQAVIDQEKKYEASLAPKKEAAGSIDLF